MGWKFQTIVPNGGPRDEKAQRAGHVSGALLGIMDAVMHLPGLSCKNEELISQLLGALSLTSLSGLISLESSSAEQCCPSRGPGPSPGAICLG